jgi:hypothetical protein
LTSSKRSPPKRFFVFVDSSGVGIHKFILSFWLLLNTFFAEVVRAILIAGFSNALLAREFAAVVAAEHGSGIAKRSTAEVAFNIRDFL